MRLDAETNRGQVNLTLAPTAGNAAVARHAVEDLVERCGLRRASAAARVVVTEAFTSAAERARGERPVPIVVSARRRGEGLDIRVHDRAGALASTPSRDGARRRLGMLMISAVAESVRIEAHPEGGTELRARVSARPPV